MQEMTKQGGMPRRCATGVLAALAATALTAASAAVQHPDFFASYATRAGRIIRDAGPRGWWRESTRRKASVSNSRRSSIRPR